MISSAGDGKRFLSFFEKVRVEFPHEEYPPVEWVKIKNE
jgi:hypothetical protein